MAYTRDQVVALSNEKADQVGISRRSLLGLLIAESNLVWNAARYAYSGGNLTTQAEAAIASNDMDTLQAILTKITNAGSNDISFGVGQQTVRWAQEGDHTQSVPNVLALRSLYFDPQHAVDVAGNAVAGYVHKYGDDLEALCRYNSPNLPGAQNPNRANYQRGLTEADTILAGASNTSTTPTTTGDKVQVVIKTTPYIVGPFSSPPKGVILHGSRSGVQGNPKHQEFVGTSNYCQNNPDGLAWTATIGENEYAVHMPVNQWGWNARAASSLYVAVEFAQATVDEPISDAQVDAFVDFYQKALLPVYPNIGTYFPTHSDLDGTSEYGGYHDGKTDVFPKNDDRSNELRSRILSKLSVAPSQGQSDQGQSQQFSFQFGFAAKALNLGNDVVGVPLEDEHYISDNYSLQMTSTGILIYSKQANTTKFITGQ